MEAEAWKYINMKRRKEVNISKRILQGRNGDSTS